jgi:uncharacterized integral membrane protein
MYTPLVVVVVVIQVGINLSLVQTQLIPTQLNSTHSPAGVVFLFSLVRGRGEAREARGALAWRWS